MHQRISSPGQVVSGFVGVDGGSTSTKAVVLGKDGEILCKTYQLSNGNPIQDTIEMFEKLREQIESKGATLEVLRRRHHWLCEGYPQGCFER